MTTVLDHLRAGIRKFGLEAYPLAQKTYRQAANEPQRPHTLFITCSDSRVDPELITQSGPGELFVTRNIGNLVPAFEETLDSVSAVIEFAVAILQVKHVVVCGHSDCGAMKALLRPETIAFMPEVSSWLTNAKEALQMIAADDDANSLAVLTEKNVLLQLRHLATHPSVAEAMVRGDLTLSGWVYDIGSGRVRISEDGESVFRPVTLEE